MTIKHYLFSCFTILLLSQCTKELTSVDCLLSLEETMPILEDCLNNSNLDTLAIKENLIGDWKLVGYGCGFCQPHTPPEAFLQINQNKGVLIFKDEALGDKVLTFDWWLEQRINNIDGNAFYTFKTEPFDHALQMNVFCSEFMFFDHRPSDGLLMLYQKQ